MFMISHQCFPKVKLNIDKNKTSLYQLRSQHKVGETMWLLFWQHSQAKYFGKPYETKIKRITKEYKPIIERQLLIVF